jgi:hypothetical protein
MTNPYPPVPPQPERIEPAKAGNAFLQGFAGCLGVGAALFCCLVALLFLAVACSHH